MLLITHPFETPKSLCHSHGINAELNLGWFPPGEFASIAKTEQQLLNCTVSGHAKPHYSIKKEELDSFDLL